MTAIVYDAAALIAADRGDLQIWKDIKALVQYLSAPLVPAPVIAQVSRSPRQARLHSFLRNCEVVPMSERDAHEAGRLLAITATTDIVDAMVVVTAIRYKGAILTSDVRDIQRLVNASRQEIAVIPL